VVWRLIEKQGGVAVSSRHGPHARLSAVAGVWKRPLRFILESAVAGFVRRFLTTDYTDFHGLYAEQSEFAENETLHLLGEELGFHNSFKIRVFRVIRGSNCCI